MVAVVTTEFLTFRGEVARLAYEARRLRQNAPPELKDDDALDRQLRELETGLAGLAHVHVSANAAEIAGAPPEPPDYVSEYRREAKALEDPCFNPDVRMQWIARESRAIREGVERTLADLSARIEDLERVMPALDGRLEIFREAVARVAAFAWPQDGSVSARQGAAKRLHQKLQRAVDHVRAEQRNLANLTVELRALAESAEELTS
jgi:hypothetical protein